MDWKRCTSGDLWRYYRRDSEVLCPPVNFSEYRNEGEDGYYLHLRRFDTVKGVPTVAEAFDSLDERLVMIGEMGDVDDSVR